MNLCEMKSAMEQKGYSFDVLALLSGLSKERVEAIFQEKTSPKYDEWAALEKGLQEKPGSMCVRELFPAYEVKRKYTLDDYYALPEDIRAELIDGELFVMLAPSLKHQGASIEIEGQIYSYIKNNKGKCHVFHAPVDVQLDCDRNTMVQPDIVIVCDERKFVDHHIMGAPDFVLEILSSSTRKKDMTIKLKKYRQAGCREYWIVDPDKEQVIVHDFSGGGDETAIYGSGDKVPVRIYDGDLKIDFGEVVEGIRML